MSLKGVADNAYKGVVGIKSCIHAMDMFKRGGISCLNGTELGN